MSAHDDGGVEIELPFIHLRVGGRGARVRLSTEGEELSDMETIEYDDYRAVRRTVRARLRFFRHAFTFVAVNLFFFLIDWSTGGGFWVQWVALIWGAFLAWEFISQFIAPSLWGRDAEERMIERELRRRRGA
jgi:hypothetical protein